MKGVEPIRDTVVKAATALIEGLDTAGANYCLVGGLAVGMRSRPRSTRDVDVLLSVPQIVLPSLLDDLQNRGFSIDQPVVIRQFVQSHLAWFQYQGVRIDLMKPMLPVYHHVLDQSELMVGFGHKFKVARSEGLIVLKLLAGRTQDFADIETLLAANQNQLDLKWIQAEWQTVYPLDHPHWRRFEGIIPEYYLGHRPSSAGPLPLH